MHMTMLAKTEFKRTKKLFQTVLLNCVNAMAHCTFYSEIYRDNFKAFATFKKPKHSNISLSYLILKLQHISPLLCFLT